MKQHLMPFLKPTDHLYIHNKHNVQKLKYGFLDPPTRRQLINLRYLIEALGIVDQVKAEQLLGFSKVECNTYLKRLKEVYFGNREKIDWED